jgi:prepilin-type N-terminal cleavage/methylation domain-containing protein
MRKRAVLERGFSLIELGIVVAVIAILATVVLVGRGFLQSSRVSKMVEVVDTIAKGMATYAGTNGGKIPNPAPAGGYYQALVARTLITSGINASVPDFMINTANGITLVGGAFDEQYDLVITCTGPNSVQACRDLCAAKRRDHAIVRVNATAVPLPPAVLNCETAVAGAAVTFRQRL